MRQVCLTQFSNTSKNDHTHPPAVYSVLCEISKISLGELTVMMHIAIASR